MVTASSRPFILILYTTLYREGGDKFQQAAGTLEASKRTEFPDCEVVCRAVESKRAFVQAFTGIAQQGGQVRELHFIGHSGMYGIMFGTTAWPEQFSPYEWKSLDLPFEANAKAFFHACRTGRWFAPFFATTFNVKAYGYFYYTTVSGRPERFRWERLTGERGARHIISVPGKKSHGLAGSVKKHVLGAKAYPLLEFVPQGRQVDASYDGVASLYDETFEDITVREDELAWLRKSLAMASPGRVLDLGCGTGSFLRATRDLFHEAVGVDLSEAMLAQARKRSEGDANLSFARITGPLLPFPEDSFDVVMSVLSFRYLDWDPIVREILRVLKPGGRLLVLDMVAVPISLREVPLLMRDKLKQQLLHARHPGYRRALKRMTTHPSWKKMLAYNPMRSEHELKWFLESRFPGGELQTLNYGRSARILAFRSPPLHQKTLALMTYP